MRMDGWEERGRWTRPCPCSTHSRQQKAQSAARMASSSSQAHAQLLTTHLLSSIRADVLLLSSSELGNVLDHEARDAILQRLDAAGARVAAGGRSSAVDGISSQMAGVGLAGRVVPPAPAVAPVNQVQQQNNVNSEQARALWSYSAT